MKPKRQRSSFTFNQKINFKIVLILTRRRNLISFCAEAHKLAYSNLIKIHWKEKKETNIKRKTDSKKNFLFAF